MCMRPVIASVSMLLLVILVGEHAIDPSEPFKPPIVTMESIKAAREKFDREMKLDTKRPWDGMDLSGPHAFEKPQVPPVQGE